MATRSGAGRARERIIETAERLFYKDGIRSVGIDRIIAEAGVAKMTLYNHFRSKDDLILAVLQYREEQFDRKFLASMERHAAQSGDRLEAFFDALKEWFDSRGFRGCSFINAAVELADARHPASVFAAAHKCRFRGLIESVLKDTGGPKAVALAPAVAVLVEGAIITAVMEGSSAAADVAREAALTLLAAAKKKR